MAKATVKLPEDFLLKVSKLGGQTDRIIESCLEAGSEVVLAKVKSNLNSVIGSGTKYPSEATGELASSLGVTPAKVDNKGTHNVKSASTSRAAGSMPPRASAAITPSPTP